MSLIPTFFSYLFFLFFLNFFSIYFSTLSLLHVHALSSHSSIFPHRSEGSGIVAAGLLRPSPRRLGGPCASLHPSQRRPCPSPRRSSPASPLQASTPASLRRSSTPVAVPRGDKMTDESSSSSPADVTPKSSKIWGILHRLAGASLSSSILRLAPCNCGDGGGGAICRAVSDPQ